MWKICYTLNSFYVKNHKYYIAKGREHMLIQYFRNLGGRRLAMTIVGNIFVGLGISIFKLSGLGNDPYSGMTMSLAVCAGMAYANFQVLFNVGLLVIQFLFGRELIGIGTLVNACFLGYIVTFFYELMNLAAIAPAYLWQRIVMVCIGVVICSFGLSLYQTADAGVAPYDSLSLITRKKLPKLSYFWHRIADDAVAALVCFLAGGIVGLGTLISAFGLGPFIHFFNEHFSKKLLNETKENA